MARPVYEIAREIQQDWRQPYFAAAPHIQVMLQMESVTDSYGLDMPGESVLRFLANAQTWRGPVARRVKAELNNMLKESRNAR